MITGFVIENDQHWSLARIARTHEIRYSDAESVAQQAENVAHFQWTMNNLLLPGDSRQALMIVAFGDWIKFSNISNSIEWNWESDLLRK